MAVDEPHDAVRQTVEALVLRARRGDHLAERELFAIILKRAVLPVAGRLFGLDDEDASQDLAAEMLEKLPRAIETYDPTADTGRDGCAPFRRWTFNAGIDLLGRAPRVPAAIARLSRPEGEAPRPHIADLYRRVLVRGEPAHEVIAEWISRSGGALTEAALEADLVAIERAVAGRQVARQQARSGLRCPTELETALSLGLPPHAEMLADWALNRQIGQALRALLDRLPADQAEAIERWTNGSSWAQMVRDGAFGSAHFAKKAWRSAIARLGRALRAQFGDEVLRSQLATTLLGLVEGDVLDEGGAGAIGGEGPGDTQSESEGPGEWASPDDEGDEERW